jgi:translation initiation factor IF-2
VIESRLDRGRGPVATVLVQKGTLHPGDIVVAGAEWGRVRAMLDDKGRQMKDAPGRRMPVEILGLSGTPSAGEPFVVVENEAAPARSPNSASASSATRPPAHGARGTLEEMLARSQAGVAEGSRDPRQGRRAGQRRGDPGHRAEARHEEVGPRAAERRRQITESDIQLAKASKAR